MKREDYLAAQEIHRTAFVSVHSPETLVEVRRLYAEGLSHRQVAERTGVSKSYISRLVGDLARDRTLALRLRCPPKSKHWRSSRQAARKQVERKLGRKLLRTEHVHHVNGDYTDNRDENLEVLDGAEHNRQHTLERLANGWEPWKNRAS